MTRYFRVQCCISLMGFKCYLFHNKISKTFFTKKQKMSKDRYDIIKKEEENTIFPLSLLQIKDFGF